MRSAVDQVNRDICQTQKWIGQIHHHASLAHKMFSLSVCVCVIFNTHTACGLFPFDQRSNRSLRAVTTESFKS